MPPGAPSCPHRGRLRSRDRTGPCTLSTRRTNRALPEERAASGSGLREFENEVITTARNPPAPQVAPEADGAAGPSSGTSVMREWMNELTGRAERDATGLRVPSDAEIGQLTAMFPDIQRDVVVAALQRRFVYLL